MIIGGGLAGLSCAVRLKRLAIPVLVLEAGPVPGGKLQTHVTSDGLRLDQGFQVLLTSYPELQGLLDLDLLKLKAFHSGALIMRKKGERAFPYLLANPLYHPGKAMWELFSQHVSLTDQALVAKLISLALTRRKTAALEAKTSTLQFLREFGMSEAFIETFWRPFLSGVFLDPELSLDSEYFLFLMKCFSQGRVTLPENGMGEIPKLLAQELGPENILTSTRVRSFDEHSVLLESGETIQADQVVSAYNPGTQDADFFSVATHYFTCREKLAWDKWLILVPRDLGLRINHLAVVSEVAPQYSGNQRSLISVSEVGSASKPEEILAELMTLMPQKLELEWVKTFHIEKALPKLRHKAPGYELKNGVYYCGDYMSSPSINGALRSGRLVAQEITEKYNNSTRKEAVI